MNSYEVACPYCGVIQQFTTSFESGVLYQTEKCRRGQYGDTFKSGCGKIFVVKLTIATTIKGLKVEDECDANI